jgi:hypothetical protein
MKRNVGGWERWFRLGAGAALVGLYVGKLLPRNAWGKAALGVGSEMLLTGVTGYCPVNQAVGHDSHRALVEQIHPN